MRARPPASPRAAGPALVVLAAAVAACKTNPVNRFRSTYESTDSDVAELETLTTLLELGVQDNLGPELEYRIDEKLVVSDQDVTVGGTSFEEQGISNRPTVDVVITSGTLRWTQLFQLQDDRSQSPTLPDNHLVRTDFLEKIEWLPPDLPQVTAWIDYRTVEDDFFTEQDRLETRLEVRQAIQDVDYEYSYREEYTDDVGVDVEGRRTEHIGRLTYQGSHLDERLGATFSLFASDRENSTDFDGVTTPTIQVFPTLAFAAVDVTPEVSTLPTNPALIDGDSTAPTGIDIGGFASGGELSWNMAVQLPPGSAVDIVYLQTVDPVPVGFAGQFTFSVWASDDGTFWTLVRSVAPYVYEAGFQRFRISIPGVTSRFLKVVNTASPAAAPAVRVAEMQVFRASTVSGATSTTDDDTVQSATTNLSWRATDELTLGADLLLQASYADSDGIDTRDETRLDSGLWATWTPVEEVMANLRASNQRIEDEILRDETTWTLQGVLTYRPIETLDFDLSWLETDRDVDGSDDVENDVSQALATAELLPTLRAEASLERNVSDDVPNQREISRWIWGAGLIADLTPTVTTTLRAKRDDAQVSGAGASQVPDPSEDRYEFTWIYRPSEQLIAEAELDWIDTFAGSGLDQRLRLDWIPFGDGAIDAQLDFDRTSTESFGDTEIDRYRALIRYSLGAFTYLEFQYTAEFPDEGSDVEIVTASFAYNS